MKYLYAVICAVLILFSCHLLLSRLEQGTYYRFKTAEWLAADGAAPRPIPPSGLLLGRSAPSKVCCVGTYRYKVPTSELKSSVGLESLGLYFPAIGGKFDLKINSQLIDLPKGDYSSVGPLIPLNEDWLRSDNLIVEVDLKQKHRAFAGVWKGAPLIGSYFQVEKLRHIDNIYQVELPFVMAFPVFLFAIAFAWLYVSTDRQFVFYKLFAMSLVSLGVFELYLSGFMRGIDFYWGSVTHYFARCLEAIGTYFLIESYLMWASSYTPFLLKLRKIVIPIQIVLAILALIGGFLKPEIWDIVTCATCIVLAYVPLFGWRWSEIKLRSISFVVYVIVLTSALGAIADALKLVLFRFDIAVPYRYFNRYTVLLLLSQTIIIYLAHFMDFFKRCKEQAVIISGQKTLATAFQIIAHDIRTPFNKLRLGLTLLDSLPTNEGGREITNRIRNEVDSNLKAVNGVLSDVLEFGRTATPFVKAEKIDLIFNEAFLEVSSLYASKDIKSRLQLNSEHLVLVDGMRMKRAMINIIENAFQAMPIGGTIRFETRNAAGPKGENLMEVVIANEGSVVPKDRVEQIFEIFQTFGKQGGTGLGLAITRKIVEAHGGRIFCRSSIEFGTEFIFTLPIQLDEIKQA